MENIRGCAWFSFSETIHKQVAVHDATGNSHLSNGGGDVKDGGFSIGGEGDALDLFHDLIGQVAPEGGEHKAWPLDLLTGMELQRRVVLMCGQERARLHIADAIDRSAPEFHNCFTDHISYSLCARLPL